MACLGGADQRQKSLNKSVENITLMEKSRISFFAMNFILPFVVISFILIVFNLHRFAFVFEMMFLLILIFFLGFAMFIIYYNKRWGWTILGVTLVLLLANTLFIFLLTGRFETAHVTIIIFSIAGLALSLFNLKTSPKADHIGAEDQYKKAEEYYHYIDKMKPKEELKDKEKSIEKTFMPGKFVASKNANKFHSPKCDWAKRINNSNQLWFDSREEAEAKGFEADRCVS